MKTINEPKIKAAVSNAVKQLSKSERGRRVLYNLKTLLDDGGYGLDSRNSVAFCVLVEAVRVGQSDTVSQELASV